MNLATGPLLGMVMADSRVKFEVAGLETEVVVLWVERDVDSEVELGEILEVVDLEEVLLAIMDEHLRTEGMTTLTVVQSLEVNATDSALKSVCI